MQMRAPRRGRSSARVVSVLGVFVLLFFFVAAQLVRVQVLSASELKDRGSRQRVREDLLFGRRGTIYDRSLAPLAVSASARTVYVDPRKIDEPAAVAATIAPIVGLPVQDLMPVLTAKSVGPLVRKVSTRTASRLRALGYEFLWDEPDTRRSYPAGTLAAQVLGFVGTDDVGLSGIESSFDAVLHSESGEKTSEIDPNGRQIPAGVSSVKPPVAGKGLVLTIDRDIQFLAEDALARGAASTGAVEGVAIVMDVRTGDVLAMANYPALDIEKYEEASPSMRRNRAITDAYEPGSVNKVITAAAAIESGKASPMEVMSVPGSYTIADKTFHDVTRHGTLRITYAEALARSSNIATMQVAARLGKKKLYDSLRKFGLGASTKIGFPGESAGILPPPDDWYATSMGTIPMGQGIGTSPLQMASVFATLANDGVRVRPRLVRGTVGDSGLITEPAPARAVRVVSAATAAKVRAMLIGVVEKGTGKLAQVDGFLVGGKTGTARVPLEDRRGYSNRIITTFAGIAPADAPRLVTLVALNNPRARSAAITAAPVFREIMGSALGAIGAQPGVAMTRKSGRR